MSGVARPAAIARPAGALAWPAALAVIVALAGCAQRTGGEAEGDARKDGVNGGYVARDARIVETGVDGRRRYDVRAREVREQTATDSVALTQVAMDVRDERNSDWHLVADIGHMPDDARSVDLRGHVVVSGKVGGAAEPLEIRTESLHYDTQAQRATSSGEVTLLLSGKRVVAHGIDARLQEQRVLLQSRVHGRFAR